MNATKRAQVPFGLRKKLMAATSMLLVAAIMLVSTSYAWFTLSTAPEITGITTSVGANGNLEIALLSAESFGDFSKITSNTGDSMESKDVVEANLTWGNLIDLSDARYGLTNIALYPSAINKSDSGTLDYQVPLAVPEYGYDGRVTIVDGSTTTATYDTSTAQFTAVDGVADYGVRAVGTADNVSARTLTFKTAKSGFASKVVGAEKATQRALSENWTVFISLAQGATTYTYKQLEAMKTVANSVGTSLNNIVSAYANAGLAIAAADTSISDEAIALLKTELSGINSAATLKTKLNAAQVNDYDTVLGELAAAQAEVVRAVAVADQLFDIANGNEQYEFGGAAFTPAEVTVVADAVSTEAGAIEAYIAKPMLGGSVNIKAYDGSGVEIPSADLDTNNAMNISEMYLDGGAMGKVAEYTGTFKAANINVTGLVNLNMYVGTKGQTTGHLDGVADELDELAAPGATSTETIITTQYGYIIDFAFRTNAAGSDLKLQTDAINRVYSNAEGANLATQGSGSTATFSYTADSGMDQSKATKLLEAVRVVFFDPADGTIYGTGLFTNITANGSEVVGDLKLHTATTTNVTKAVLGKDAYEPVYKAKANYNANNTNDYAATIGAAAYNLLGDQTSGTGVASTGDGDTNALYTLGKDAYELTESYKIKDGYTITVDSGTATPSAENCWNYKEEITAAAYNYLADANSSRTDSTTTYAEANDGTLTDLPQNDVKRVSALVYMDGENIDNSSVAATGNNSGTLDLNLQFSSSAKLVPMENNALKNMEKAAATNP